MTFTLPEDAKPGHKWQTRDGREVTDVRVNNRSEYPIIGRIIGRDSDKENSALYHCKEVKL